MLKHSAEILRASVCVVTLSFFAGEPAGAAATPDNERTDLFRAGEDGYFMYRIPGIVVTGRGTILAYCEARTGRGDWTRQDVLLRRSTDGGRTWSAPRKMAVRPPDLKPNPTALAQGLGKHNDMTAHNAVAIADRQPGMVHFLYHVQYARVFYRRSDDDGLTWSEPREITQVIDGFRDRYDWKVVGNGCGHGIQLQEGPHRGRLAVALWLSTGTGGHAHRPSDVAAIYSDDGGQTWQRGDFIARDGDFSADGEKIVNPSETMLVELSGGRVLANLRTESARHRRLLSISPDGAAGWSKPEFRDGLLEPICMASMVRLPDGRILFSNPDNLLVRGEPGRLGRNRDRRNLTLRVSNDDGKTWRIAHVIEPGPSGYSDLAATPDGTVYCLYERGAAGGDHFHTEALTLARLPADVPAEHRAATASMPAEAESNRSPAGRPNVLLIVSEDHGIQLGCYGDPHARTPVLDRLAGEGARFEYAYVTTAGCSQSRASIFTGLYPHQNGQIGLATHGYRMFRDDFLNIPRELGRRGYRTGCIGKAHVNPESALEFHYHRNAAYNSFSRRDMPAVAREAAEFIAAGREPFFLMVNYSDAHGPWIPRDAGLPRRPHAAVEVAPLPFVGLQTPGALKATADYYSCISRLDAGIGLLLDALEQAGRRDDTLVIYLSDHGPSMPRGKMTCYEGGVRIPMIVRFPGRVRPGVVERRPASTVDLFPTILDACGIPVPDGLPGGSLLELVNDSELPWRRHVFTEFTVHWPETFFPQRAVRDDRYKLIHNLLAGEENPVVRYYRTRKSPRYAGFPDHEHPEAIAPELAEAYVVYERPPEFELYDLEVDPWETCNMANEPEMAEVLDRLRAALAAWRLRSGDGLLDGENLRRLKAENDATFRDGQYQHVGRRDGFAWQYPEYLSPPHAPSATERNTP